MAGDRFRNRHRLQTRLALQSVIESPQKFPPRLWIIFPGILAVEDHGHDGVAAMSEHRLCGLFDVAQKMVGGLLRIHARVDEADQV